MSEIEINDYLSKCDKDLANNVIYRVYGMPGPIFMEKNNDTPTPEPGPEPGPDYSEPFYINVRGAVTLEATSGLQMSTDKTNWTDTAATTLSSGKTYFRVATDQETPLNPSWTEDENSDYDVGGNINSLVKVNFANDTNCYAFGSIFSGKSALKSAGNLILPATTLAEYCYDSMFMSCSSLTAAPSLPATTLATYCYNYMFYGCESLTSAPELPAATLVEGCYYDMFGDCINLSYIKCLATDISASECTEYWLSGVAASGTFVKNPSMSGWTTGTNGIPEGWTVQDATN